MQSPPLSLAEAHDALLRFRGRYVTVSGTSDLTEPPFPTAPIRTIPKKFTIGPRPRSVVTQAQQRIQAERDQELARRRGRPREDGDVLHVGCVDRPTSVDISVEDFVVAYADDDWSVVINTLEGDVRFDADVDVSHPIPKPPFEHRLSVDGVDVGVRNFGQPLMRDDRVEVDGKLVRVVGIDHSVAPTHATCLSS